MSLLLGHILFESLAPGDVIILIRMLANAH